MDLVSRKWVDILVSAEESSTQVKVLFEHALKAEALIDLVTPERLELATDDPARPILLAVSDNGSPMTSEVTQEFMALMAVLQHHGRPHTPTDQAWIETLFGHIKAEWPHLEAITAPPCWRQRSPGCAWNTTGPAFMRASATSLPTTSMKVAVTPSARPAGEAWSELVMRRLAYHRRTPTTPRRRRDLVHFSGDFRG